MKNIKSVAAGLYMGIAAIGLTGLSANQANAALIGVDLAEHAPVDTFLTRDTATGLDWLDLPLTTSISFNSITTGGLLPGGALAGQNPISGATFAANPFRHATLSEVITLFTNAGIPDLSGAPTGPNVAPGEFLKALIGPTGDLGGDFEFSDGITSTPTSPTFNFAPSISRCFGSSQPTSCNPPGPFDLLRARANFNEPVDRATSVTAHWLVRPATSITEPGTFALLLGGLAALAGFRRRRRNG